MKTLILILFRWEIVKEEHLYTCACVRVPRCNITNTIDDHCSRDGSCNFRIIFTLIANPLVLFGINFFDRAKGLARHRTIPIETCRRTHCGTHCMGNRIFMKHSLLMCLLRDLTRILYLIRDTRLPLEILSSSLSIVLCPTYDNLVDLSLELALNNIFSRRCRWVHLLLDGCLFDVQDGLTCANLLWWKVVSAFLDFHLGCNPFNRFTVGPTETINFLWYSRSSLITKRFFLQKRPLAVYQPSLHEILWCQSTPRGFASRLLTDPTSPHCSITLQ
jgi:hypothetical protein